MPDPEVDTICDGDLTNITIQTTSTPTNPTEFRWKAWAENAGAVEVLPVGWIEGLTVADTITYPLDNQTDQAQRVYFEIESYTVDNSGNIRCIGESDTVEVWVEPTTNVDARPEVDTICDGDLTSITIQTTSTPTNPTEFRWKAWAENAGAVEVLPVGWIEGLTVADTIAYPLDNQTDQAQRVYFEIESYTVDNSGNIRCIGESDTVEVWVEPTTNVDARPEVDTICDGDLTSITIQTTSTPTHPTEFRWKAWAENAGAVEVLPVGWIEGLTVADTIAYPLDNQTDQAQRVYFEIESYTVDNSGNIRCIGESDTVEVWVEPTTNVDARPEVDTICDGDLTSITIQTTSIPTNPTEFRWKAWAENAGAVEVLPVGWIEGLTVADTITYPLDNQTNQAQRVYFEIESYTVDNNGNIRCIGESDTVEVWVEPTTNVDASPEVDTICDGDLTSITIQTTSTPTNPTEFRWKAWAENAGAVEVLPVGWIEGLTVADTITYPLDNQTDQAQRVYFEIESYTVDNNGNIRCIGESDTVAVWVEPTPIVILTPVNDTICTSLLTSIGLSTKTVALNEIYFRYIADYDPANLEVYTGTTTGLPPGYTIRDSIVNLTTVPQLVTFIICPYLQGSNGLEKCGGICDTAYVWVAPTLIIQTDTISTYIGGRNIRCHGEKNGFIILLPVGGLEAFSQYDADDLMYDWSHTTAHTRGVTGLSAGPYTVTVSDKLLCRDDSTFILTEPDTLLSSLIIVDSMKCNEGGTLAVQTNGGGTPVDTISGPPFTTNTIITGGPGDSYGPPGSYGNADTLPNIVPGHI